MHKQGGEQEQEQGSITRVGDWRLFVLRGKSGMEEAGHSTTKPTPPCVCRSVPSFPVPWTSLFPVGRADFAGGPAWNPVWFCPPGRLAAGFQRVCWSVSQLPTASGRSVGRSVSVWMDGWDRAVGGFSWGVLGLR